MWATSVRPATPDDAAAIAGVHVRSWQMAYRGVVPDAILERLSVEQRRRTWSELLEDRHGAFTLVADRGGEVVGFCSMAIPSRDDDAGEATCEVGAIYVEPTLWRAGVGARLLETALDTVRDSGWREVTLWVFAANASARAFYESFGFASDGAEMHHQSSGQTEIRLRASL